MNLLTLVKSKLLGHFGILNNPLIKTIAWFAHLPKAPPDKIFGVANAYNQDKSEDKVNLSLGVYRDDDSKPFVLKSVRMAEEKILCKQMNKEYPGILGYQNFCKLCFTFAMGENKFLQNGRVAMAQSIAGTGALGVAAMFMSRYFPNAKDLYVSNPTWENHSNIFKMAGFNIKSYRYYDSKNIALDCAGLLEDLEKIPDESLVLFHAHAHNPTGFDPEPDLWDAIAEICKSKGFYIIFDSAYQGFASGDPEKDAYAIRTFAKAGINMIICQSFSKNMGLYGDRVGCISFITDSPAETEGILSNLSVVIAATYINPPLQGARIAELLLSDKELKPLWLKEMKVMADRLINARQNLKDAIVKAGSKNSWDHITKQIGMFAFTGLKPEAVTKLRKDFHIYLLNTGRISIAGITTKNVEYIANAFHEVTK